ncbi:sulfonate ABC transporter substrate-binding protein [Actinomadura rubrobrunea]|uniref:Sulfonate ABC transporter substrate-binding protein n=1 Tax=Actinomadura rubrobrunea TaxID=115335 RepID=A0A9W6UV64_9ACTN|nr:ABC transporter substrate-binding protein [Actinomadura rubrobrunea]GLW62942.1 sulfonate ABC transporter substrate-binding protein [Actinomadura rubrobrunea]
MRRFGACSVLLAGCLLAAPLAAGCGGTDSGSGGNGLEKSTITVAALPLVDEAGLHIAVKRGYFEQEGLTVKIRPVAQSVQAVPALKNGQVDVIAGGNYVTFIQSFAKGTLKTRFLAPSAAFAPGFMTALVPKDSPIRQPKDLEGKTIGVNILNNIQQLVFNEVLKAHGVEPSEVRYVVTPFPQMGATLQQHKVDAVLAVEPFSTAIQRTQGARMVVDAGSGPAADIPASGVVTEDAWVKKNPKTAAAVQRAIDKAQRLAQTDRKAVEEVLPSYAGIDARMAAALSLPRYPASLDPAPLQRLADLMLANGLLTARLDAKQIIFTPSGT